MRCFRVKDERSTHVLIVASTLLATRTDPQLRELLNDIDLADYLFRAEGSPVLLMENGLSVVE